MNAIFNKQIEFLTEHYQLTPNNIQEIESKCTNHDKDKVVSLNTYQNLRFCYNLNHEDTMKMIENMDSSSGLEKKNIKVEMIEDTRRGDEEGVAITILL